MMCMQVKMHDMQHRSDLQRQDNHRGAMHTGSVPTADVLWTMHLRFNGLLSKFRMETCPAVL